ncbi:uncharacterized protein LOC131942703 [Physella acuta]|uniref:uncharacterized protein LOC131942703 n=1 Tax=Physella acuta TaxID=109671 RepID=UPI0027DC7720|nr:uncharacterized protein LOC131942703 [Physella acuta]
MRVSWLLALVAAAYLHSYTTDAKGLTGIGKSADDKDPKALGSLSTKNSGKQGATSDTKRDDGSNDDKKNSNNAKNTAGAAKPTGKQNSPETGSNNNEKNNEKDKNAQSAQTAASAFKNVGKSNDQDKKDADKNKKGNAVDSSNTNGGTDKNTGGSNGGDKDNRGKNDDDVEDIIKNIFKPGDKKISGGSDKKGGNSPGGSDKNIDKENKGKNDGGSDKDKDKTSTKNGGKRGEGKGGSDKDKDKTSTKNGGKKDEGKGGSDKDKDKDKTSTKNGGKRGEGKGGSDKDKDKTSTKNGGKRGEGKGGSDKDKDKTSTKNGGKKDEGKGGSDKDKDKDKTSTKNGGKRGEGKGGSDKDKDKTSTKNGGKRGEGKGGSDKDKDKTSTKNGGKKDEGKGGSDKDKDKDKTSTKNGGKRGEGKGGSDKDKDKDKTSTKNGGKRGEGKGGSDKDKDKTSTKNGGKKDEGKGGSDKDKDKDKKGKNDGDVEDIIKNIFKPGDKKNSGGSDKKGGNSPGESDKKKDKSGSKKDKIRGGSDKKDGGSKTGSNKDNLIKKLLDFGGTKKSDGKSKSPNTKDNSKTKNKGSKDHSKGGSKKKDNDCEDVKLESVNYEVATKQFDKNRKIASVSLVNQISLTVCALGKTFGFEGHKAFVNGGCRGTLRVCYERDTKPKKLKCKAPYRDIYGYCLLPVTDNKRTFSEAADKCASLKGRLAQLDNPDFTIAGIVEEFPELEGHRCYFGGGSFSETLVTRVADKFKMDKKSCQGALKKFSSKATVVDMNQKTSLSSQCVVADFDQTKMMDFADCNDKLPFICEQLVKDDDEEDDADGWSEWINSNSDLQNGDDENLSKIIKKATDGTLPNKNVKLCKNPIKMQCRAVGTQALISKSNTNGIKLDKACERNAITCKNNKQAKGAKCPDYEVRFKCPPSQQNDCSVESFRQKCEQQRKDCVQTPLGGQCVKKKREKTGKEEIGTSSCTVNAVTYKLFECSSRGDPHYRTPDGTKLDFQGGCSYNLMSTCNNYPELGVFPAFSLVSSNIRERPEDKVTTTKSFQFTVQDKTYLFTRGGFEVNGLKRSAVDYEDDIIKIMAERKGSSYQLTIQTDFCMLLKWDNKHGLYAYVPEVYKTYLCGICGNFDDNPKNDLTIPGSNKAVTADVLGRFHMVGGVAGEGCTDTTRVPEPCSAEDKAKYSGNEYCGIFKSSNSASPLVKAVTSGSVDTFRMANLNKLDEYFDDCVMDQCSRSEFTKEDSCLALESSVQELIQQLNIDDEDLDDKARSFANCPNNCGRNMVYKKSYRPQCQDSCKEPQKSLTCDDLNTVSGCACQDGFLLDADQNCVPADDCDDTCTVQTGNSAFTLNDGQSSFVEACSKLVTCQKGTINETNLGPCSENADCVGGTKCVCKAGFKGNGRECFADLACKPGFYPAGTKCYQVRFDNLDWHSAALVCGSQGAQLARIDNEADSGLEQVLRSVSDYKILAMATSKVINCGVRSTCKAPKNEILLSIRAKDSKFSKSCEGKLVISGDRSKVTSNCAAKSFIIETVDSKVYNSKESSSLWIGGNLDVIGPNARLTKSPYQVDAPRQIDMTQFQRSSGCFQAVVDKLNNVAVFPNPDCKTRQGFICDYDNTKSNSYDPNDFKFIKDVSNQQGALDKCKNLGRTLAVFDSIGQLNKALSLITANVYVYMSYDKQLGDFRWGNGIALSNGFGNFDGKPDPNPKGKEQNCVILNKGTGKLQTQSCATKSAALCGPITTSVPAGYTPYFPATTVQSVTELKQQLMRDGQPDQLCASPLDIECSALSNEGRWVTNFDQQGTTIACKPESFSCLSGQELDCKTFRVRILCPQTDNQCTELPKSKATPCDGGKICIPAPNHYICQCPLGTQLLAKTQTCSGYCGECSAWGDPHYTTYSGDKYNNMGLCTTQFTGTCPFDEEGSSVSYQVLTKNKACGKPGASCINKLRIRVKNLSVPGINGVQLKENLDFVVFVGAKTYTLNGKTISQTDFTREGVYTAVVRQSYFELFIHEIGLQVFLSDTKLKVMAPEQFRHKMCGLCGDCGSNLFKLRNGTAVSVPGSKGNWDDKAMAIFVDDWKVADEDDTTAECQIPKVLPNDGCTDAKRAELSKPNLCGVFKDKSSSIQECFDKTDMEPDSYFDNCLYDACNQDDSQEAVCTMVKAFAQECLSKNIVLNWRTPTFCPRVCENGKIFRTDVSCEPTCGRSVVSQTNCNEAREEGCACPAGKMKQGEDCVDPKDCGCNVPMKDGTINWHLPPGGSVLMPECKETAVCYTDENGSSQTIYRPFNLDQNAICNSNIPPTVECANGYSMAADGVTCIRDPKTCSRSYENINGLCVKVPSETNEWRLALKACNREDGTLISIDTDDKFSTIKNILADKKIGPIWIAGRVVARKGARGIVNFQSVLSDNDKGKIEVANYDLPEYILNKIKLSPDIRKSSIPNDGLVLSVILTQEGDAVAVLSTSKATPVCVLREVPEDQTQWFDSCNNDDDMEDGDQETHHSMLMNPNCLVCLNPMDVRCVANPNPKVAGSSEGDCANRADGLFYDCNQGNNCIDKGVSTKCTKDYDECATGLHDCPANSECVNTVGDFSCKCKPEFPLMVRGQCQSLQSCVMQGPATPLDYVYNIQTLSGKEGLLDFTCKFKLATLCNQYKASSGLPSISIYILSTRVAGALQPYYSGTCYNPDNGVVKTWAVTPDLLQQGYIMLGDSDANSVQTALSFTDPATSVSYQFVAPGTLIISHQSGFFKVTITANSIRTEFSGEYRDKLCGVCAASSAGSGGFLELSQSELQEVSVLQESLCAPRTPIPSFPTEPPASPEPNGPPQQPDQSNTPSAIFPTYPDDVSTRGEPLEPVTIPSVISTLAPVTTQSTTLSPDEDPCSYQAIDDCNALNLLCNVPIDTCKAAICPGTQDLCQYLVSQQFTCAQTDNLKVLSKRCNKLCGANMEFIYTSRTDQPSCAKPTKSDMVSQNANDDVGFICACEDGYVQSRAECVRLSDCGCVMPSGKYYPPGFQWRSANCAELKTCLGNNNVDVQVSSCGKNTECANTEKGPTCVCKKGLFGNPDMPQGCEKGEVSDDGSKTCYTYATNSGDEERCDCNMGYASSCEECLDMDECAEGTHQCNLAYEKCVNVRGGYRCDCADGYTFKGGKCVDLDECLEQPGICGDNSQCTNKVGSYECSCCVGYLWNPVSKSCERDNAGVPDLPDGAACCAVCNDAVLCDESISSPIPYCYTDNGENKQYSSYMKLYQDRCINNQPFDGDKLLRGKCPAEPSVPPVEGNDGGNPDTPAPFPTSCDAPSLCSAVPPPPPNLASGPVCGPANSQTPESFPSYCDMVKAECKKSGNPADLPKTSPIKANPGKCIGSGQAPPSTPPPPPAEPIFTPWTPYSTCQLVVPGAECGVGIQIRNRELAPYDDGRKVRDVANSELSSNRPCYVPCPKPESGEPADSNCPETSFCNAVEPVCGSIGTSAASQFKSECELNVTACQKSDVPHKLYAGDCDAEDSGAKKRYCEEAGPVDDLMTYNVEKDGLHCVGQPVNVGNCGNLLCSGAEGTCCKAVEYEKIQVVAECFSQATKESVGQEKHTYFSATKCMCQPLKP